MSKYEDDKAQLKELRCEHCHGSGERDDAELGDTSYNTWVCNACNGTGYASAMRMVPVMEVK